MTLWQRIKNWFVRPDPDDIDSKFPADATGPIPQDMHAPGEATHKMMLKRYPTPDEWDLLSERRKKRWMLTK